MKGSWNIAIGAKSQQVLPMDGLLAKPAPKLEPNI